MRILIGGVIVAAISILIPAPAGAVPVWADKSTATIHPGIQTFTSGAQCTANFVFYDQADNVYIGQAAHCAGTGSATDTNGCDAESLPLGTPVQLGEGNNPGTLVYSSWLTMQEIGEQDPNACQYNDFALVQVNDADVDNVNPTVPFWDGPHDVNSTGTTTGDVVYSYGNSSLRFGIELFSPKMGFSIGDTGDGWSHNVFTVTPGIPGDSGSAFLDENGNALGTLSTLQLAPFIGSNGVSDFSREFDYLQQFGGISGIALATATN